MDQAWYERLDRHLSQSKFIHYKSNANLYTRYVDGDIVLLIFYANELLVTRSSTNLIYSMKSEHL